MKEKEFSESILVLWRGERVRRVKSEEEKEKRKEEKRMEKGLSFLPRGYMFVHRLNEERGTHGHSV